MERKKGCRKGPKAILVVCEGYTEENMVTREKIRRRLGGVTVLNMKGSSPIEIVETAKRKFVEDGGYDKVFCIFDRDKHGSFTKALQEVQKHSGRKRKKDRIPIIAIISNPCIEVWIMCHFQIPKSAHCSTSKSMKAAVKKYLPAYDENDPAVFRTIEPRQPQAIKNAKDLARQNSDPLQKPFTDVHRLLELL